MLRNKCVSRLTPKRNPVLEFFIIKAKGLLQEPKLVSINFSINKSKTNYRRIMMYIAETSISIYIKLTNK